MEKRIEKSKKMFETLGYKYESYGDNELIQFGKTEHEDTKKQIIFRPKTHYWFCSYWINIFNRDGTLKEQKIQTPTFTLEESKAIMQMMKDLGWL